jgi:hypothetical protein
MLLDFSTNHVDVYKLLWNVLNVVVYITDTVHIWRLCESHYSKVMIFTLLFSGKLSDQYEHKYWSEMLSHILRLQM